MPDVDAFQDAIIAAGLLFSLAAVVVGLEPAPQERMADRADELWRDEWVSPREARWLEAWRGDGVCVLRGPRPQD